MTSTMPPTSSNDVTQIRKLRHARADHEQREAIAVDQLATADQPAGEAHE